MSARRKLGRKAETFLPDDIFLDMLIRLPAKDVLKCRCVCKKWRVLTSTSDFTDLHFRRSSPMILKDDCSWRSLLDRCWEPAQTRSKIHYLYERDHRGMLICHNGLIVAHGWLSNFIIYNPVYDDDVVHITTKPLSDVYGVFFHPVHKEYCTLWRIAQSGEPLTYQYKILNLESTPKWRDIRNPPTQQRRFAHIPSLLVDKYIYWMLEPSLDHTRFSKIYCNIMEYDIEKEEFRVIPCPTLISVKSNTFNVNLVDIDGVVSVVRVLVSKELVKINMWKLKDDDEAPIWTSSNYIINYDLYMDFGLMPKAVAFDGGELILVSNRRLYVCNLKLGTIRNFGQTYSPKAKFYSHVVNLVSLKNCKSKICMEEDDENNNKEKGHGEEIQTVK